MIEGPVGIEPTTDGFITAATLPLSYGPWVTLRHV